MTRRGRRSGTGTRRLAAAGRLAALAALLPAALGVSDAAAAWYRGAGVALIECGGCHDVRGSPGVGQKRAPPSLPALSGDCRWSAGSLAQFLSTSHALRMGNLLSERHMDDLVAYIRSLRLIETVGKPEFGASTAARHDVPRDCR